MLQAFLQSSLFTRRAHLSGGRVSLKLCLSSRDHHGEGDVSTFRRPQALRSQRDPLVSTSSAISTDRQSESLRATSARPELRPRRVWFPMSGSVQQGNAPQSQRSRKDCGAPRMSLCRGQRQGLLLGTAYPENNGPTNSYRVQQARGGFREESKRLHCRVRGGAISSDCVAAAEIPATGWYSDPAINANVRVESGRESELTQQSEPRA